MHSYYVCYFLLQQLLLQKERLVGKYRPKDLCSEILNISTKYSGAFYKFPIYTSANHPFCSDMCFSRHKNAARAPPDPVVARISPAKHLGAVTENFQDLLNDFIDRNPDNVRTYSVLMLLSVEMKLTCHL